MALATLTLLACGSVLAQWQWLDNTGRKVFSDTPPPAGTPEKNIIKTPGPRVASAPPGTVAATTAAQTTATAAPRPSGRDELLEAKKKQAEEAEQAKKKAEADKMAKARADNCERAKRAKATLDTGIRIATTNAKGEREIMDDKSRAEEAKRMEATIRSDCGPLPPAVQ
ncbi:MAG: DUF4124 domain-containing protein [Comamonadaceae bacterium]|nr:DUF4124 domain-containing protein [Comamonadaceae bacterium]